MAYRHYCVNLNLWLNAIMAENAQNQDKFILRMPDGMRDQIKIEAAKNRRSMNAEIIERVEKTLKYPDLDGLDPRALMEIIAVSMEGLSRECDMLRAQLNNIQAKHGPFPAEDWATSDDPALVRLRK
jgi:plasmid stability protein